jgi:hypothetical protein
MFSPKALIASLPQQALGQVQHVQYLQNRIDNLMI